MNYIGNLVKYIIEECNGKISSLIIDDIDNTGGLGITNPSLIYYNDKLYTNIRSVNYTQWNFTYHEGDRSKRPYTINYLCEMDENTLQLKNFEIIDTSLHDIEPKHGWSGLEDVRMVNWDNKLYYIGCRRDVKENAEGRIEFSEIIDGREVERYRIEPPDEGSYCEKNWMPILDKPYYFVKWSNPVEIVKVDLEQKKAVTVHTGDYNPGIINDLKGGTPLIEWYNDTYMCIVHETQMNGKYKHRIMLLDRHDLKITKISNTFDFMNGSIEFCIGLVDLGDDIIISFGYNDNCSYAVKCSKNNFNELIWTTLN
jgi:predicted GH43/DUF377 family glycosyl hydrolase